MNTRTDAFESTATELNWFLFNASSLVQGNRLHCFVLFVFVVATVVHFVFVGTYVAII